MPIGPCRGKIQSCDLLVRNLLHWLIAVEISSNHEVKQMITYTTAKDPAYDEQIKHALREHNLRYTGPVEFASSYIYALEGDALAGALGVRFFWDWVTVGDAYYQSVTVLRAMIEKAWQTYRERAVGIKLFTPIESRFADFVEAGFTPTATITYGETKTYYYADLCSPDQGQPHGYEVAAHAEPIPAYQVILDRHTRDIMRLHGISDEYDEIQVVALDGQTFVGGVQGEVYDDIFHIGRLVVLERYRGHAVGRTLVAKALEEAKARGVTTAELGTTDFQAKTFYEKMGFAVVHTRMDNPRGYKSYTMIRRV